MFHKKLVSKIFSPKFVPQLYFQDLQPHTKKISPTEDVLIFPPKKTIKTIHLAQPAAKAQDALWRGRFQVHQADGVAHWNLADD